MLTSTSILDYAAITALGDDVPRTIASLRCGHDGFCELPFIGISQKPLRAAPVRGYAEGLMGIDRYVALALYALEPIFARIPAAERRNAALIVGLPRPERPGVPAKLATAMREILARHFGLERGRVVTEERGRCSVFAGLMRAGFLDGAQPYPIIGGVDILTNPNSLTELSARGELQEQWDGYLPGEAAAFLRLGAHTRTGYWGSAPSWIAGLGAAIETADGSAEAPLVGVGMNRALRAAVAAAGLNDGDIGLRINDINGARAAFEDDGMATARFYRAPREHVLDVWHLGSHVGETGAAAGALELIWGASMGELGLVSPQPIMLTCSDASDRCALVLRPPASHDGITRAVISRERIELNLRPVVEPTRVADPGMVLSELDDPRRELAGMDFDTLDALVLIRDGHLRDPSAPWKDIHAFEQRMLASIDALAWTRDRSEALALERIDSEEIEEMGSAILMLGSGELTDQGWDAIRRQLATWDEARAELAARQLALCPNPRLTTLLVETLADDTNPIEARALLRAIAWRGGVLDDRLISLARAGRFDLLAVMLEIVGFSGRTAALTELDVLCRRHLDALELGTLAPFLLPTDGQLPYFPAHRYVAAAPFVAALAASKLGASLFAQLSPQTELTPELIEALGWSAEAQAIPWLIDVLDKGDDALKPAAAFALNLLIGADLFEDVELPEEDDDDDDAPRSEAPDTIPQLSLDAGAWRSAHAKIGAPIEGRVRHGQAWSRASPLGHLARPRPACAERVRACWQHAIVTSSAFPLDPHQFVGVQALRLGEYQ